MTYSNQPLREFLQDMRRQAEKSKAPPALFHKLDELLELHDGPSIEERIEDAAAEGYAEAERINSDTLDELQRENDALANEVRDLENQLAGKD